MPTTRPSRTERLRWFDEARFGMFIHWGVYAVPGRGEWVMYQDRVPVDEYATLAQRFRPHRYDPHAWAAVARDAGMRYMVLTTRHHDGFSLWDSDVSDFTAPKTAAKRDLVADYADACRSAGLRVGFYYSLLDWRWPAFFKGPQKDPKGWAQLVAYVHAQLRELMTRYGQIDLLWYDGGGPVTAADWKSAQLNAMVRRLQPGILINDRSHRPEDFDTPEQHLTASRPGRAWESCFTMNRHWGHMANDRVYKSATELIHMLTATASGEGNLLLNVGPKPDGTLPRPAVTRLEQIGRWLRTNGEAIYGSQRCALAPGTNGVFTRRGENVYLHVHWWPGDTVVLPYVKERVRSARVVGSGERAKIVRRGDRVFLTGLPRRAPDRHTTVIRLKLEE